MTQAHLAGSRFLIAAGVLVAWASYGFHLNALSYPQPDDTGGTLEAIAQAKVYPAFLRYVPLGLLQTAAFSGAGHPSFLLGETGAGGWPHYYLVGLLFRTQLPLLALGLGGFAHMIVTSRRHRNYAAAIPAIGFLAILAFVSLTSSINIGVRHILILYPLLAIGAGYAVCRLCETVRLRIAVMALAALLVAWQFATSLYAHPDQMAYFNALAGNHPERILINADLDWGQDLDRLSAELKERGVESLSIDYNGSADISRHGLPPYTVLKPDTPATGWIAVSLFHLAWYHEDYAWLEKFEPATRVGKSINLYFIEEEPASTEGG